MSGRASILIIAIGLTGTQMTVDAVSPESVPPIEVHSLTFVGPCEWRGQTYDGCIEQDRTVTPPPGANTFAAIWEAQIIDAETSQPIKDCEGTGGYEYRAGRYPIVLPLPVWTGNPACSAAALGAGDYKPAAAWRWGTDGTEAQGVVFTLPVDR